MADGIGPTQMPENVDMPDMNRALGKNDGEWTVVSQFPGNTGREGTEFIGDRDRALRAQNMADEKAISEVRGAVPNVGELPPMEPPPSPRMIETPQPATREIPGVQATTTATRESMPVQMPDRAAVAPVQPVQFSTPPNSNVGAVQPLLGAAAPEFIAQGPTATNRPEFAAVPENKVVRGEPATLTPQGNAVPSFTTIPEQQKPTGQAIALPAPEKATPLPIDAKSSRAEVPELPKASPREQPVPQVLENMQAREPTTPEFTSARPAVAAAPEFAAPAERGVTQPAAVSTPMPATQGAVPIPMAMPATQGAVPIPMAMPEAQGAKPTPVTMPEAGVVTPREVSLPVSERVSPREDSITKNQWATPRLAELEARAVAQGPESQPTAVTAIPQLPEQVALQSAGTPGGKELPKVETAVRGAPVPEFTAVPIREPVTPAAGTEASKPIVGLAKMTLPEPIQPEPLPGGTAQSATARPSETGYSKSIVMADLNKSQAQGRLTGVADLMISGLPAGTLNLELRSD
jgi:hypothetical protein